MNGLLGVILIWMIGHFFYDSLIASLVLLPLLPAFLKYRAVNYGKKRRDELRMQFCDAINSISANQKAGYSIENAFREAWGDMARLYGAKSVICNELNYIKKGLDNNLVLEQLILDLGYRSGIDDIRQFGEVFSIAKRNGGNLTEIIEMTANMIEQKADVENEINVLISSRRMEANIMSAVPFLMILYMKTTSDGFFDELYHNLPGVFIMSFCLVIYISAYLLSRRIVDIHI